MKIDGNYVVLDSGRRLYAFAGVLGLLDAALGGEQLVYGYDGYVSFREDGQLIDDEIPSLTPVEREEIAKFMIDRWTRWAKEKSQGNPKVTPSDGHTFEPYDIPTKSDWCKHCAWHRETHQERKP